MASVTIEHTDFGYDFDHTECVGGRLREKKRAKLSKPSRIKTDPSLEFHRPKEQCDPRTLRENFKLMAAQQIYPSYRGGFRRIKMGSFAHVFGLCVKFLLVVNLIVFRIEKLLQHN